MVALLDYNPLISKNYATLRKMKSTVGKFCWDRGEELVWGDPHPRLLPLYIAPFGGYSPITPAEQAQPCFLARPAPEAWQAQPFCEVERGNFLAP